MDKEVEKYKKLLRETNGLIHDLIVGMQAAVIEAHHNGCEKGMEWIYNALEGPGSLPDMKDQWANDANDYYNFHRNRALGPCEICGRPSGACNGKHVACNMAHLEMAIKKVPHNMSLNSDAANCRRAG